MVVFGSVLGPRGGIKAPGFYHSNGPRRYNYPRKRQGGAAPVDQQKSEAEVALELMRLVLEQAGNRRLTPTRTLALYHLCKEAVAYDPEGQVTADYLEENLKKLLQ